MIIVCFLFKAFATCTCWKYINIELDKKNSEYLIVSDQAGIIQTYKT
jgi:hypothetical protein